MAPKKDVALIKALGGPRVLAEKLGYGKGGVQRVQNWLTRPSGIPPSVKLERPDLFLQELTGQQDASAPAERTPRPVPSRATANGKPPKHEEKPSGRKGRV